MGLVYSQNSIVSIISMNNGLTKEEIFKINEKHYRAKLGKHWNMIMSCGFINHLIYEKNNKFYIKPEVRENIERHSELLKIINKSNKPIKKLITKI